MNRQQRRFGRVSPQNDSESRFKGLRGNRGTEVKEYFPPKNKRHQDERSVTNRCCSIRSDQRDFGQLTEYNPVEDEYHHLLLEQYGFEPIIPDTINQLKELKKALCNSSKIENCSQYATPNNITERQDFMEISDGSQWQNIDRSDDIEKYISPDNEQSVETKTTLLAPKNIIISDVPHIKVIAEKFSRYKLNNIELRKLEERVVCVEYDIFDQASDGDLSAPVQKMRAFFSIKPVMDDKKETALTAMPSFVKHKFNIVDEDLNKPDEKEIEIIDRKIAENQPYLQDLKRVLSRKKGDNSKMNKTSLDLLSLYEMAKRDHTLMKYDLTDRNYLSKAELQEVKDLILKSCTSSAYGITRRTVKRNKDNIPLQKGSVKGISESIIAELLKDDPTLNS